jgi:competence protein ComEA
MNKIVNAVAAFAFTLALSSALPTFAQDGKMAAPRTSARKAVKGIAAPEVPAKLKAGETAVNVNKAKLEELVRVPGIGNSLAERILEYRKANGKFNDWKNLTEVKGIGEKKLARLKPFLSL